LAERTSALGVDAAAAPTSGVVGGGTCPDVELPSWSVRLSCSGASPDALARLLRSGTPPVVGRVEDDQLVLDVRTVFSDQEDELVQAVSSAVREVRARARDA
jgi:L-seryl-tRNA(Ser) seleniumtransferase